MFSLLQALSPIERLLSPILGVFFWADTNECGIKQGTVQPSADILNEKPPFKDVQKGGFPAVWVVGIFPVRLTRKGVCQFASLHFDQVVF